MTHSALNVKGFSSSSPILSFSSRNRRKVFKTFLFTLEVEQRTILFSFRKLRKFCLISLSLLEKGNSYFSFSSQNWGNCFQISHFECGIGYDSFDPTLNLEQCRPPYPDPILPLFLMFYIDVKIMTCQVKLPHLDNHICPTTLKLKFLFRNFQIQATF